MITHRLQQTISHLIFATEHDFYFEYSKTKNNFVFSSNYSKFIVEDIDMLDALVYIANDLKPAMPEGVKPSPFAGKWRPIAAIGNGQTARVTISNPPNPIGSHPLAP